MRGRVKIGRFNPERDPQPWVQEFDFDFDEGMTVLDVLNQIRGEQDPTLSYSYCCRNGHCGLCAMRINGTEALACKQAATTELEILPLDNVPLLKDLVVDREECESRRPQLRLFLERWRRPESEPEKVDMEAFELFKTASRCIECMACLSACPVLKEKPHAFAGPMALALLARPFFDPRDDMDRTLMAKDEGVAHCIECGLCSKVCPRNVNPAMLIQKMKAAVEAAL